MFFAPIQDTQRLGAFLRLLRFERVPGPHGEFGLHRGDLSDLGGRGELLYRGLTDTDVADLSGLLRLREHLHLLLHGDLGI